MSDAANGTLTIGRLAERAGVHVETIRYYERRGLLAEPARTRSGYRCYDEQHVWRLEFIARAKRLGFTLTEIGELFGETGARSSDEVLDAAHGKLTSVEAEMRELAARSCRPRRLVEVCRHGDDAACVALVTEVC